MRKLIIIVGALTLLLVGTLASADEQLPDHPHALVIGVEIDADSGVPTGVKNCVELAAGQALPNSVHHAHVHMGRAGEALSKAGHFVVPLAPYPGIPWDSCDSLLASVGL